MVPVDLKDLACALGLILLLGVILIFLRKPMEGFTDTYRCDLDNPCAPGLKCLNGFCAKTDPKPLVDTDPVPLLPPGGPAPYF